MKESTLGYRRVQDRQLLLCLKLTLLKTRRLLDPEVLEIEEVILERMKPETLEPVPGIQGETLALNTPTVDPETLPGGVLKVPRALEAGANATLKPYDQLPSPEEVANILVGQLTRLGKRFKTEDESSGDDGPG